MKINLQWTLCLLGNFILLLLTQIVNNSLTPYQVVLNISVLFLIFPATTLPFTSGLLCTSITGLVVDASGSFLEGAHLILYGMMYTALYWARDQYKRISISQKMMIIQIANLVLIISLATYMGREILTSYTYWINVSINLIVSGVILSLVSVWFLRLQSSLLAISSNKTSET